MGFLPRKTPSYDEALAQRVRKAVGPRLDVTERKMFGGLAFLVNGNMAVGINRGDLMVRVGPGEEDRALAQPGARPMDFTGRPLRGFVFVDPTGHGTAPGLSAWLARGLRFAGSLPPK